MRRQYPPARAGFQFGTAPLIDRKTRSDVAMTPELLDTFLDLIETRSFHRSAERLGLTQSTVSARVQALETTLDAKLFIRSRAGTQLTTEGLKFEPHARMLRHAMAEARRAVTPSGLAAVTLRIGIQNDLAAGHIGDWIAGFRRALPETAFYIEPDYSAQMCADLGTGHLDFAVLYSPRAVPDLHFTSVGHVTYRLVSSDGTTRAQLSARALYPRQLFPCLRDGPRGAPARPIGHPARGGPERGCRGPAHGTWRRGLRARRHGDRPRGAGVPPRRRRARDHPAGLRGHPPAPPHLCAPPPPAEDRRAPAQPSLTHPASFRPKYPQGGEGPFGPEGGGTPPCNARSG